MTVNPKKLRPYDEPPRRRRPLIPEAPGSAAIGFAVVALLWLAVATALGVVAVAVRAIPDFGFSFELGFGGLTFELDARRLDAAFVNAAVYGWLSNAGLAAVCFITPRLVGRPLVGEKGANFALGIWNLAVVAGIAALYVVELGPHQPLTAFPWPVDGGLAFALLIVTGSFAATVGADMRTAYVSTWFMGAALLAFLALVAASAAVSFLPLDDVAVLLASTFVSTAIGSLWLLGIALAVLHYVIPRDSGRPLHSLGAAMLAWLAWLVLAPFSGLVGMVDTSVPYYVPTIGSAATILLLAPVALTAINLLLTLRGRLSLLFGPSPVAFATVALTFLLATALLQAIGALRSVHAMLAPTEWVNGLLIFSVLGAPTLTALALAEHALPRMLRRAWGGGMWSAAILWTAFGGAGIAGLALMGAGLAEGSLLGQGAAPEAIADALLPFRLVAIVGLGLSALSGAVAVLNAFLMYTSGEPAAYAVPGGTSPGAASAAAGH